MSYSSNTQLSISTSYHTSPHNHHRAQPLPFPSSITSFSSLLYPVSYLVTYGYSGHSFAVCDWLLSCPGHSWKQGFQSQLRLSSALGCNKERKKETYISPAPDEISGDCRAFVQPESWCKWIKGCSRGRNEAGIWPLISCCGASFPGPS